MSDLDRVDRVNEILEEALDLIGSLDEEVDETVSDIIDSIRVVQSDCELLEFDDEGALKEPDLGEPEDGDDDEFDDDEDDFDDDDDDDD